MIPDPFGPVKLEMATLTFVISDPVAFPMYSAKPSVSFFPPKILAVVPSQFLVIVQVEQFPYGSLSCRAILNPPAVTQKLERDTACAGLARSKRANPIHFFKY